MFIFGVQGHENRPFLCGAQALEFSRERLSHDSWVVWKRMVAAPGALRPSSPALLTGTPVSKELFLVQMVWAPAVRLTTKPQFFHWDTSASYLVLTGGILWDPVGGLWAASVCLCHTQSYM